MSSPIHKFLFSPPSSPPSRASSGKHRPPPLNLSGSRSPTIDQSSPLSPSLVTPNSATTATLTTGLVPRSPRTPQNKFQFTLNDAYPTRTPRQSDVELGIYSAQNTPRVIVTHPTTPRRSSSATTTIIHSPPLIPSNIPTHSVPRGSPLPKPLLRLVFLLTLVVSSIVILVYIPSTRLPTLKEASQGRRLAYDEDGKAWLDLMNPVKSLREGLDRDYVPVKIKSSKMLKRGLDLFSGPVEEDVVQKPLIAESAIRASSPKPTPRPIPTAHEIIAVQSYLLGSAYNTLSSTLDTSSSLDANTILGFKGDLQEMLHEIEDERIDDVVVWYGGDGLAQIPHNLLSLLATVHGANHKPTLLPLYSRPDRQTLISLCEKHNLPISAHPIVMIGNKPLIGDVEILRKDDSELRSMMGSIGWVRSEREGKKEGWKPKFAVVKRREVSEVERALEEVAK